MKNILENINHWIWNKRLNWQYQQEQSAESLTAWWWYFRRWWRLRPMKVECASGCGTRLWHSGENEGNSFCSESCAYYGRGAFEGKPAAGISEDEIPF